MVLPIAKPCGARYSSAIVFDPCRAGPQDPCLARRMAGFFLLGFFCRQKKHQGWKE